MPGNISIRMAALMLKSEDNFHDDDEDDEAGDEWLFLELMILTLSLLSLSVAFAFVSRFTTALLLLAAVAAALLLFLLLACREIKGCSSEEAEAEASPCWLVPNTAAMVSFAVVVVVVMTDHATWNLTWIVEKQGDE